jgi:hypothetical protein
VKPIRPLVAALFAAALLAPAAASAAPAGWTPPPPPTGDGTSEVQEGTIGEPTGPQFEIVQLGHGGLQPITTGQHGTQLFTPPAEEPAPPAKKTEEDEQSIEDAIRERNRMLGDAAADERARQEMMRRIMGGIG